MLKALTLERDQAVQALRTRGPLPGKEVQVSAVAALFPEPPLPPLLLGPGKQPVPQPPLEVSHRGRRKRAPERTETGVRSFQLCSFLNDCLHKQG